MCNIVERLGLFEGIVPSLVCILTKQDMWHPRWKMPLGNPWKRHFWGSKIQNIPRCLAPQELVPLVWVPKPPTIHHQPATQKLFDSCEWKLYEITPEKRFLLEPEKTTFKSLKFHKMKSYAWWFYLWFLNSCEIWYLFSQVPI